MSNASGPTSPLSPNYEVDATNPESPTSLDVANHIKLLLRLEDMDPLFAEKGVRRQLDNENFSMLGTRRKTENQESGQFPMPPTLLRTKPGYRSHKASQFADRIGGKSVSLISKQSLITKDMLEGIIALDNEKDRNLIINILKKRSKLRSKEEIMFLQKGLIDIKFFRDLETKVDEDSFISIFKSLTLERFGAGQKIFNIGILRITHKSLKIIGDYAKKFYILIQGSVYVLLKNVGIVEKEDTNHSRRRDSLMLDRKKLPEFLESNQAEDAKRKEVEMCYSKFWIARTLNQGETFGEIGLQNGGERNRTATVICRESTLLGILNFDEYQAIVARFYEKQYSEKVSFLEKVDALSHWKKNQILAFALHIDEIRLQRNKIIFKEGTPADNIYFIKTGEVELQKNFNSREDEMSFSMHASFDEKEKPHRNITSRAGRNKDSIKLGRISEGDYFGTSSSSFEEKIADFTVIVTSQEASLFYIPRETFLRIVKDRRTLELIKNHLDTRNKWHQEMIANKINVNNQLLGKNWLDPGQSSQKDVLNQSINAFDNMTTSKKIISLNIPLLALHPGSNAAVRSTPIGARPASRLEIPPVMKINSASENPLQSEQRAFKKFVVDPEHPRLIKYGTDYDQHQRKLKRIVQIQTKRTAAKEAKTDKIDTLESDIDGQFFLNFDHRITISHRETPQLTNAPEKRLAMDLPVMLDDEKGPNMISSFNPGSSSSRFAYTQTLKTTSSGKLKTLEDEKCSPVLIRKGSKGSITRLRSTQLSLGTLSYTDFRNRSQTPVDQLISDSNPSFSGLMISSLMPQTARLAITENSPGKIPLLNLKEFKKESLSARKPIDLYINTVEKQFPEERRGFLRQDLKNKKVLKLQDISEKRARVKTATEFPMHKFMKSNGFIKH